MKHFVPLVVVDHDRFGENARILGSQRDTLFRRNSASTGRAPIAGLAKWC